MKNYLILTLLFSFFSFKIYAQDDKLAISGNLYSTLNAERFSSDNNNNDGRDIYAEANAKFKVKINDYVDLKTSWWFLNVKAKNQKNRFFDDQGLLLEELLLDIHDDMAGIYLGKFNPKFAIGWDYNLNHGIWSNDFAYEYQLVGKLGAGIRGEIDLEDKGVHIFNFAGFYNDHSKLNDTIFSKRDQIVGEYGKSSDNSALSSYIINLYGKDIDLLPSLFYNISYRDLHSNETGYSFALGGEYHIGYNLKLEPFIEFVKIDNFNSANNRFGYEFGDTALPADYEYRIFIFPVSYDRWGFTYAHLYKDVTVDTGNFDVKQQEFSFSYNISDSLKIELGRKKEDYSNQSDVTTIGSAITYNKKF